jgi:Zn-dependent M16 (insulinase) family peptidase
MSESENEISKEEKRRIQLREAQRRYYNSHKKKEKPEVPPSYQVDRIRNYHKTYYEENKDILNARAKQRYTQRKAERLAQIRVQDIPNLPTEPLPTIPLILPSVPIVADFERIGHYNC